MCVVRENDIYNVTSRCIIGLNTNCTLQATLCKQIAKYMELLIECYEKYMEHRIES